MDVEKILAVLRAERDLIDRAIVNLDALMRKGKRGRGRPLGSVTKNKSHETTKSAAEL